MPGDSIYETDILVWSEQQAAALRTLEARHDLPNQLDLANIVEEIDDVGRSQLQAIESLVGHILVHLILLAAEPDAPYARGWRTEIAAWADTIGHRATPSMHARIDMNDRWWRAIRIAALRLDEWNEAKAAHVRLILTGSMCPLTLAALCQEDFDGLSAAASILAAQ